MLDASLGGFCWVKAPCIMRLCCSILLCLGLFRAFLLQLKNWIFNLVFHFFSSSITTYLKRCPDSFIWLYMLKKISETKVLIQPVINKTKWKQAQQICLSGFFIKNCSVHLSTISCYLATITSNMQPKENCTVWTMEPTFLYREQSTMQHFNQPGHFLLTASCVS